MAASEHPADEREFTWRDGERVVRFGSGELAGVADSLADAGWEDYALLSTPRALAGAPADLAAGAAAVHEVPPGKVADTSAALVDEARSELLVALGGGRVIDTAKAVAAVRGARTAAIPTTLSGAEMTGIHRLPHGRSAPRLNRPALVIADPEAMTGLGEPALRASAMNALAHGAEALFGPLANPFSSLAAERGAGLIAGALDQAPADRDRGALALGSLMCAHAIDGAGLALHHAVCQELVRGLGLPHAETNAAMLPHTMEFMRRREPRALSRLAVALEVEPDDLAERLRGLAGEPDGLGALGAERAALGPVLAAIAARLGAITPQPTAPELEALVEAAW